MDNDASREEILLILQEIVHESFIFFNTLCHAYLAYKSQCSSMHQSAPQQYVLVDKIPDQVKNMQNLVELSDIDCINNLRMSRNAFGRLCFLLEDVGGLSPTKNISISKQVAMFLSVLAHHKKNCVVKYDFKRSGATISKYFNGVLDALLKLHPLLLANPKPVNEDCTNNTWKWFKGCLGALDGTYINVVAEAEKTRYRSRKGEIFVNVLGVCDRNMNFIYVLTSWEGSAVDSRVLRDAVTRENGLKISRGNYYMCDNGYTNGDGFLTPYRGVRYHLDEWSDGALAPQNFQELFYMKHSRARNVIERAFGLLKMRWAILRSNCYYPIKVQNKIIMACCLVNNFIRTNMHIDPMEEEILDGENFDDTSEGFIDTVESSQQWTTWRNDLARSMFDQWQRS